MVGLFLKYLKPLRPYGFYLGLIFIADLLIVHFALIAPLFSRVMFDYAYPLKNLHLLNVMILALVVLYFLEFFINMTSDYMGTYVDQSYTVDLTKKLFHRAQRLPLSFYRKRTSGDLVHRLTHDIDVVVSHSIETFPEVFIHLYTLVGILAVASWMNYKITLLALVSLPLYIFETQFFAKKQEQLEEQELNMEGAYLETLHEKFSGIKTIKAFTKEDFESQKIEERRRELSVIGIKKGLVMTIALLTNSVTIRMWSVFVTWMMGYLVIQGELSIGEVVALMVYVAMIAEPVQSLAQTYTSLKSSMASYRRVDEIFLETTEEASADQSDLQVKEGQIHFENLDFRYHAQQAAVLTNLKIKIPARSTIALVGESGAGKSTLISLLLRFFEPQQGVIWIDGQNVSQVALKSLRDKIGLVQQDFTLFSGTLWDNLVYGQDQVGLNEVRQACQKARILDFIDALPDGFGTEIGPGGEGLSGGQKQRLAIARVLLKDPPIIVFDEATSALDAETEYHLTEVIRGLMGQKSLIIIAHRLSTIKMVDQILMMDKGQVVERGCFADLIEKKGAFFRFYTLQYDGFETFKRQLGAECDRVGRYGSHFNLLALSSKIAVEIENQFGPEGTQIYMRELSLMVKKELRKGDHAAILGGDCLLVILPEIDKQGLQGFRNRLETVFRVQKIILDDTSWPITLDFAAIQVHEAPPVVDELIWKVKANLKNSSSDWITGIGVAQVKGDSNDSL